MAETPETGPSFNLWTEPWITLERREGGRDEVSVEQALLGAQDYAAIHEPSPLVVAGIHRLLVAVLQGALDPRRPSDLHKLWDRGRFPESAVKEFGKRYGERFDLFSPTAPFLQSADLPLQPAQGDKSKTVAYLSSEIPAGTEICHYRHGSEDDQFYCPVCAAGGLAAIPAFATSGGAGIKPSINGVPPIYVLPAGDSLFACLAASLTLPEYQPEVAAHDGDAAWWAREPLVERGREVLQVGYLHSLTFPARRVRLHPEPLPGPCTRCGRQSAWGVRTMVFEMGECRPKDAPFWFDPFAAYRLPGTGSKDAPTPIRPGDGKAVWREFAGLFLQASSPAESKHTRRPRVLDQMADLEIGASMPVLPFRCVGLRTDMKAKVFEWVDAGFDVPPALLADERAGLLASQALQFSAECGRIISGTFGEVFRASPKRERYRGLKARMEGDYWAALAAPFRDFVLALGSRSAGAQEAELARWADVGVREAQAAFQRAAAAVGDDGASLRRRVQGEDRCRMRLSKKRKEYLPNE